MTLTVTDAAGSSASSSQTVTVSAVAAPTVTLAVSPDPPLEDHPATFRATATAASGHSIVGYAWTFGDGTSQSTTGPTASKTYTARGTYVVTVTATDDTGQTASAALQVTITSSGASFTVSPTNPAVNDTVRFNGSASTAPAGATITDYAWDFGDGNTADSSEPTASHRYSASRTYVVRLTVTYSSGGTGTTTQEVEVSD